ncbi:MAG: Wzz/FepE/Etk N-terminal domain-containing protein [Candidatus Krumholzibacteria bacterium]|nr:Wzz/FepE/Etk N-terminal domain-containing protein [Candidatus Krumholzibacteria bacterium]
MNQGNTAADQDIDLASLLNILWRRRLFVLGLPALGLLVGVLYGLFGTRRWEATVTIRPGITAFSPEGAPHRQWRLKDITRFYEKRLYRPELARRLGLPLASRIVIQSEYVAQSLQDMAGGDVITLWTTATSPDLAAALLDTSLTLFAEFAEADTVSSQIKLTRDGLLLQVRLQEVHLAALAQEEQRLNLQIASARAESLIVVADSERLRLDLDRLAQEQRHLEQRLLVLREEEPRLAADLTQLDLALRRLTAAAATEREVAADIPSWVRRDAVLDSGSVLESLTRAKLLVQQALGHNRARQDSLAFAAEVIRLDHAKLEIHRETSIRVKVRDADRKIGELILSRDTELPAKRREIDNTIDAARVKLSTIAPLQRVGTTVVSDRPVRPRPLRAILILVLAGGAGGVCLAFIWDYVSAHRREIFRS